MEYITDLDESVPDIEEFFHGVIPDQERSSMSLEVLIALSLQLLVGTAHSRE